MHLSNSVVLYMSHGETFNLWFALRNTVNSVIWNFKISATFAVCMIPLTFACNQKSKSMDISEILDRPGEIENFVRANFDRVEYDQVLSPVFPFKADFVNRVDSLKFCSMHIQQCWIKKVNTLFAFFMVVKRTSEIERNITSIYGKCDAVGSIYAEESPIVDSLFMWHRGNIYVETNSYYNFLRLPNCEMCDLIILRNMSRNQLSDRSE